MLAEDNAAPLMVQALPGSWTAHEERVLVEFIMTTTRGDSWSTTINQKFWDAAAKFVSQRCNIRQQTCKQLSVLILSIPTTAH